MRSSYMIILQTLWLIDMLNRIYILPAHFENLTLPKTFLLKAGNMVENLYLYKLSNALWFFVLG